LRERVDSNIVWIGLIPVGWKVCKADNLFTRSKEKGNSINLEMLTVSKNYGVIVQDTFNGAMKNAEDKDLSTMRTIHAGDYIISLMSFEGGIEYSEIEGVCSPAYSVFRFKNTNNVDRKYFKYLFKSTGFVGELSSFSQGIRNGKTIKYDSFKTMDLPIPPLPEQQAISAYLDTVTSQIDTQISYYQQLISNLKSFKQSIISESVTGKIAG
jgi:type I restriction enzyme S subunit